MKVVEISDRESTSGYVGGRVTVVGEAETVDEAADIIRRHTGLPVKRVHAAEDEGVAAAYNVGEPGDVTSYGARVEAIYFEVRS